MTFNSKFGKINKWQKKDCVNLWLLPVPHNVKYLKKLDSP